MKKMFHKIRVILFCKILQWHAFPWNLELVEEDGYHGITNKYKCPHCGYIGMVDSQGNLF